MTNDSFHVRASLTGKKTHICYETWDRKLVSACRPIGWPLDPHEWQRQDAPVTCGRCLASRYGHLFREKKT